MRVWFGGAGVIACIAAFTQVLQAIVMLDAQMGVSPQCDSTLEPSAGTATADMFECVLLQTSLIMTTVEKTQNGEADWKLHGGVEELEATSTLQGAKRTAFNKEATWKQHGGMAGLEATSTLQGAKRTAFLVRTWAPTDAMIGRITSWAEQLAAFPGGSVDFFVSVDRTKPESANTVSRILEAFSARGIPPGFLHIHTYSQEVLFNEYPRLPELERKYAESLRGRLSPPVTWLFHAEPINHWFRRLPEPAAYEFIWVIEDDVGFTGSISHFLQDYASEPADLISQDLHPFNASWWYSNITTSAFEERVGKPTTKFLAYEQVQRFSSRLIGALDVWLAQGASACSEMLTPTVVRTGGMVHRPFDADHMGNVTTSDGYPLSPSCMSLVSWEVAMATDSSGRGKLYHPLKF